MAKCNALTGSAVKGLFPDHVFVSCDVKSCISDFDIPCDISNLSYRCQESFDCALIIRLTSSIVASIIVVGTEIMSTSTAFNPFNASCSKLLLFKGFSAILV